MYFSSQEELFAGQALDPSLPLWPHQSAWRDSWTSVPARSTTFSLKKNGR